MHYHRHIWRNSHATCTYRLALSKCRPTAFSPTRRINDPPPTMACPVAADHKTLRTLPWAPCKPTPFSHRSPVQFPSVAIVRLPITVHHRHQRTTTTTTCSMCHGFPKHRKYNTYNIHIYIYIFIAIVETTSDDLPDCNFRWWWRMLHSQHQSCAQTNMIAKHSSLFA